MDDIQPLIDEIKEFRAEVSGWRQEYGERVMALETTLKPIVGNGQPGRLSDVECRVGELERGHWRQAGGYAVISAGGVVAWEFVKKKLGFIWLAAVMLFASSVAMGQTAKVVVLSPQDAQLAKSLYDH